MDKLGLQVQLELLFVLLPVSNFNLKLLFDGLNILVEVVVVLVLLLQLDLVRPCSFLLALVEDAKVLLPVFSELVHDVLLDLVSLNHQTLVHPVHLLVLRLRLLLVKLCSFLQGSDLHIELVKVSLRLSLLYLFEQLKLDLLQALHVSG